MTAEEAVALLQKAAEAETLRGLATRLGINAGYLCHVLKGEKDPKGVLRRFGLEQVINYRRARAALGRE